MSRGQLGNSQSSSSLDRSIERYEVTRNHIQNMVDRYVDTISELINESDP